jgi:carbon monoxide dehydrogenase subunit G
MKLEFSGAPEVGVPRAVVWQRLTDPEFVAASAPGVEAVESISPTHFRVTSGLGVGTMRVQFGLDVELSDVVEPERLRMVSRGKGAGSEVDVVSSVRLEELGSTRTRLTWAATCTVSGMLANLGCRFIEATARRLTEDFWSDFAERAGKG